MIDIFINENKTYMYDILRKLCAIPAPSFHEEKRAEFIKDLLLKFGAEKVIIDEAKNVIFEIGCKNSDEITVFAAHTDTVFPDMEAMPIYENDGRLFCPGVGDDTASVVVLLMFAKYFIENKILYPNGVMFVFNSCEEGLGNLFGTKTLFKNYKGRIKQFISLDGESIFTAFDTCVGSKRYKVSVKTEGGHSYENFGNKNAVVELYKIINAIYSIEVPKIGNSKTTYNVGMISGGTSINTIPQNSEMFCEYRSDNNECIEIMNQRFEEIFNNSLNDDVKITVEEIGYRPCQSAKLIGINKYLCDALNSAVNYVTNKSVDFTSASTDSNVPMSLGIPSITFGVYNGCGAHTREENIVMDSMLDGLRIVVELSERLMEM